MVQPPCSLPLILPAGLSIRLLEEEAGSWFSRPSPPPSVAVRAGPQGAVHLGFLLLAEVLVVPEGAPFLWAKSTSGLSGQRFNHTKFRPQNSMSR